MKNNWLKASQKLISYEKFHEINEIYPTSVKYFSFKI